MNKPLTTVSNITTGKLDSNAAKENGAYPFFTCAPEPLSTDTFSFDDDVILLAGNNAQGDFHINRYCGKFDAYQRTYVITAKEGYDIDYINYSLELALRHLKRIAQGSQTKFLTMQILDGFMIEDIPFDSQKNLIASIKAIDAKIALNKRINAELEAMAKTIYNYWFVQYDFPDENGKPYRTSGGEMEWNEQLKREIPKGWSVQRLESCLSRISTGLNPRDNFKLGNGAVKYITVKNLRTDGSIDFSNCDIVDATAQKIIHERSDISIGDILFASIAPLGRCHLIWDIPEDWDINESVFSIRPNYNKVTSVFTYMYFMSDGFISKASSSSTGSIFKGIRIGTLLDMPIIVPSEPIVDAFSSCTKTLLLLKHNTNKESEELTQLRDWLLPMLMNGQATVE